MRRIGIFCLACTAVLCTVLAGSSRATPQINGATIETRTFNDCPLSTVTTSNNYPSSIQITDAMSPLCVGFANLHSFSFSADGGATAARFDNPANFHFGADFKIEGAGEGEGGLRLSPWYGQYVDGRFMANATTGEIACFGGAIPFYSFTVNHGITYTKGTTIHLELTYLAHDLFSTDPATIQYRVVYNNNVYDSPVLPFGEQNPNECDHGLWGMLNDGRAGGYFQPRANTGASLTATWSNIAFECLQAVGTPAANGATIETRTFNDCPLSTVATSNNYPASIQITDTMNPLCVGFANLHSFSFSEDGGATAAVFHNNSVMHYGADFKIEGAGEGEGGLRLSPWYGQYVDGRFMANATTGEIACFGGAIPFYSFTANHGVTYTKGTTIHLELTYDARDLTASHPATIQYRVVYNNTTYDSPVLPFGEQNPVECVPHGLWGMLNEGRAGGYFQPRANTGAALTATWSNITYAPCALSAQVALRPESLNKNSHGKWVTAFIEPTPPASASDIDVSSLLLNGTIPVAGGAPTSIGDFDDDGIPDLMVKFSRFQLLSGLGDGTSTITVTGLIGCECFQGTTEVTAKALPALAAPAGGSLLAAGAEAQVQWTPDASPTVDLVSSFDDGNTWSVEAENIPNSGSYAWTVPGTLTDAARVAVVQLAFVDASGVVTEVELGESGKFTIASPTGVGTLSTEFALRGVIPNPSRNLFNISFSLPNAKRATLSLFDVSGRQVAAREVGGFGIGVHSVALGDRENLRPGLYLVRLSQAGINQTLRALIIP